MTHHRRFGLLVAVGVVVILTSIGCDGRQETPPSRQPKMESRTPVAGTDQRRVRAPAVAGLFYPKDEKSLSAMLDKLLSAATTQSLTNARALICPHAGYEYSGPIAANAYQTVAGRSFDTVIILAASHYTDFRGVSVPASDAYETPLGKVPVSEKAKLLAKQSPFVFEPRCFVQRPSWSGMASKPAPPDG